MRFVSTLAVLAALCIPAAIAQTPAAAPATAPCSGVVVTVRLSEITPSGSVEKFMAAVDAHRAWYKSHGIKNNQIVVAKVADDAGYSAKRFLSYHINPPMEQPKHDAAWDAYVKLYTETSKVVEQFNTCMPETVVSTDPVPWMKM